MGSLLHKTWDVIIAMIIRWALHDYKDFLAWLFTFRGTAGTLVWGSYFFPFAHINSVCCTVLVLLYYVLKIINFIIKMLMCLIFWALFATPPFCFLQFQPYCVNLTQVLCFT